MAAGATSVKQPRPPSPRTHPLSGHRMQLLPFTVEHQPTADGPGLLTVTAPPNAAAAPPGFYLVFLVAGDLYSDGVWVQIREPAPKPLAGVVASNAQLITALSSNFEGAGGAAAGAAVFEVTSGDGGVAAVTPGAAGAGAGGLRVTLASFKPAAKVRVASGPARLPAGAKCTALLWARGAAGGQTIAAGILAADGKGTAALPLQTLRLNAAGSHCLFTLPSFKVEGPGPYQFVIEAELGPGKGHVDIDDVEVACA